MPKRKVDDKTHADAKKGKKGHDSDTVPSVKGLAISDPRSTHDATDTNIKTCAFQAHKKIEEMYRQGRREMFKDERFIQFIFYEVLCDHYKIKDTGRVVLEFPAQALQGFKPPKTPGAPRALDIAIDTGKELETDKNIPIAIEMKLAANPKKAAIQSDLVRLSFLQQSKPSDKKGDAAAAGPSGAGSSAKKVQNLPRKLIQNQLQGLRVEQLQHLQPKKVDQLKNATFLCLD